ncbi:RCC1 domain-containing protein [Leptothrix ochracea]|uniref:RCC1 domain-containing protein n=1 Tax=Leptothrix ochracea TaxID=735331 RepID=UPI0034E1C7C8
MRIRLATHLPTHLLAILACLSACGGDHTTPSTAPSTTPNHRIAAGGATNCRIDGGTGALACWGANDLGQIGHGSISLGGIATPTRVDFGPSLRVLQVALGVSHACALLSDHSVRCWGDNSQGQLGQDTAAYPYSTLPMAVAGVSAKALALGFEHSCVINLTDAVQCWGGNSKGQLGQSPTTLTRSALPQTIGLGPGQSAKDIQSGYNHLCLIARDDTVQCWGDNQYGQLGDQTQVDRAVPVVAHGLSNVHVLSTGAYHSCAATGATLSCWGHNQMGQLGSTPGTDLSTPTPFALPGGVVNAVSQLAAGLAHTCALIPITTGGSVQCWGSNANHQLSGTSTGSILPVTVPLNSAPEQLVSGLNHSCIQSADHQTWCWGAGSSGRLGPQTTLDAVTPVSVP